LNYSKNLRVKIFLLKQNMIIANHIIFVSEGEIAWGWPHERKIEFMCKIFRPKKITYTSLRYFRQTIQGFVKRWFALDDQKFDPIQNGKFICDLPKTMEYSKHLYYAKNLNNIIYSVSERIIQHLLFKLSTL
jgi:hypothetical protein